MNFHPALLFFFLSALQDGNIGLINAEIPTYKRTEGQNITIPCPYTYTGRKTYICKDECKKHILKMNCVRTQRGRYIMEYKNTPVGRNLQVTITQLTKSDSGRYWCALEIPAWFDQYKEFYIIVTDAPSTTKPTRTTTTQSFRRSSTNSPPSDKTTNQSEEQQNKTTFGVSGYVLTLVVPVTASVVLSAVFLPLLLYKCMKRRGSSHDENSKDPLTSINIQPVVYENFIPVSKLEDSPYEVVNPSYIYETLNPITIAHDQTYCTLRM